MIPVAFLILVILIPLTLLAVVLYFIPGFLYDKFILGKSTVESNDEVEIEAWSKIFQSDHVEIESLEFYPEDEFDDTRWHNGLLMKLRTFPHRTDLISLYFLTDYYIFRNSLILFQVDRDIDVRVMKIVQVDLETLEMKLIMILDDFYTPSFNLLDKENLAILCKRGYKKIEVTLRTKEIQSPTSFRQ